MSFRQKQRPLDAVAVMPFYGQGQGQGPSDVGLRGIYLNATLDSVRAALTRTVVVAVHNERDVEFVEHLRPAGRRPVLCGNQNFAARSSCSMAWRCRILIPRRSTAPRPTLVDFYTQVLYLPNIRPEKLGAASLIAVHRLVAGLPLHDARLYSRDETRSRRWDHKAPFVGSRRRHQNGEEPAFWRASKYVYYTESDQILRIRSSKALAAMALGADPSTSLLVPHRGVPLPTPEDFNGGAILATEELRFNGGWSSTPLDAGRDACCFPSDSHACLHTHAQSREALRASTKLLRAAGALS